MWQNAQDTYFENAVLSASPVELVHLLYQACTSAVRDARSHLAAREIAPRARSISKAQAILTELSTSLDHSRGGEISRRLAQIYEYLQRRLLEANLQQSDEPLAEVLGILSTLSEAWEPLASEQRNPPSPAPAAAWAATSEPADYVSSSWSF